MDKDKLIADLLFAYVNKDKELAHRFEMDAVNQACNHLINLAEKHGYSNSLWESVLKFNMSIEKGEMKK